MRSDEVWVTVAEDGASCIQALVLLRSLRNTYTNRKFIVLTGPLITAKQRSKLELGFDGSFKIYQELLDIHGLSVKNCAKIQCLGLTFFRKCVFVDPALLVLNNFDNIFELLNNTKSTSDSNVIWCVDDLLQILLPSVEIYENLVRGLQELPKTLPLSTSYLDSIVNHVGNPDPNEYFQLWLSAQCANRIEKSDLGFMVFVDLEHGSSSNALDTTGNPAVVKFTGKHPLDVITQPRGATGIQFTDASFEKIVFEQWKIIYDEVMQMIISKPIPQNPNENEPIAIIGMSARLPGANNLSEFWQILINGQSEISHSIPENRWTQEQSCLMEPETRKISAGLLKCPVDEFDSQFFQMSPFELINMDPQQRFLLEVSWEALEDASIDPTTLKGSQTGVFTGIWGNDYEDLLLESGFRGTEFYRCYMGNSYGASSARLSHFFEFMGPNISVDSGCSSSMVTVGLAVQSLRNGDSNLALAGGVNLILRPFYQRDWDFVLSPDGKCKTFDSSANGYCRAEGCGVLVLKRLSDAVRDGDRIRAVIRGYGQSQEGTSFSMGTPTLEGEILALELAIQNANVDPRLVSYVEAHGTGTKVGDPMEMEAIQAAYSKGRIDTLLVGSVKTNVGHTESCSGITGIIKTVLALEHEIIPPHINLDSLNPKINLEAIPAVIPLEPKPWKRTETSKRIAGVSSFGITGTNAHAILEESPILRDTALVQDTLNTYRILTLSAKTEDALNDLIDCYENFLTNRNLNLADVAFTANTGRAHFQYRTAILGDSCEEIKKQIESASFKINECPKEQPKLCFLFTGQGSQFPGMGKTLYENSSVFRSNFDMCDKILIEQYGLSIRETLWGEKQSAELGRTIYSQTSIFVIEYCLLKLWESWGITPDAVVGHSLGEFVAATAAGVLTLDDALKLVSNRSQLIDNLPRGKMLVIRANKHKVENLMKELPKDNSKIWIDIAAVNSAEQTVVSGTTEAIQQFSEICNSHKLTNIVLSSTHPFHSRAMDPMLQEYGNVAQEIIYSCPICTYVSGMEGTALNTAIDATYWIRHTKEPVRFMDACKALEKNGPYVFLEVGPRPVLTTFVAQNTPNLDATRLNYSIRQGQNEWRTMCQNLANLYTLGFEINFKGFHKDFSARKVSLPFYPFQRSKYWFPPTTKNQMASLGGNCIHPLLGFSIENASSQNIFHNYLDVSKQPFLKDHRIGSTIILPGAGYTEICLAAGKSILHGDSDESTSTPVLVENITFKAPFVIPPNEICQTQVIVSSPDYSGSRKVEIFKLQDDFSNHGWVCYSEGNLKLAAVDNQSHTTSLKEIRNQIDPKNIVDVKELYAQLLAYGLNFGEAFQDLKQVWNLPKGLLAEVWVPEDHGEYMCHPVVIDSMIQLMLVGLGKAKTSLYLPISIRQFQFLKKRQSQVNYVYLDQHSNSSSDWSLTLFDENGDVLSTMSGVELVPTTLPKIEKILSKQDKRIPDMLEESWHPLPFGTDNLEIEAQDSKGIYLSFSDQGEMSQNLSIPLEQFGYTVVKIEIGPGFKKSNKNEYFVRPDTKEDFEATLSYIKADYPKLPIVGILYLWGLNCDENPLKISVGFLYISQTLLTYFTTVPNIVVITQGAVYIGDQEPLNPAPGALWGLSRTLRSENPSLFSKCIDIDPKTNLAVAIQNVMNELLNIDEEYQVAFRDGKRFVPRLLLNQPAPRPLTIPNVERYALIHPPTKAIVDLKFGPVSKKPATGNQIEIQVKAMGLNFKEILNILKPEPEFDKYESVGMDFAGIVTEIGPEVTSRKVGDAVLGFGFQNGALPSHITTYEDNVASLPQHLTFTEGAGLPCAFATAYETLINIGNLKSGESILIHTASGGVGLMAIQLANYLGAHIFATAGSRRKRAYLQALGIKNVFDSRSLLFGEEIHKATNGRGVDMVLNSITGPGFKETSLNALAKSGRFVEMSKLNIWTVEEVKSLRPDVQYSIVDINSTSDEEIVVSKRLHRHLDHFLNVGIIKPLPSVLYGAENIREALTFLQSAKHIGKVIVSMPKPNFTDSTKSKLKGTLFNDRSTYLITGGLGGIGLEVAKWMVNQGAKYIVLTGRSPPNSLASEKIDKLKEAGAEISVILADVGDYDGCKKILKDIANLPPLKGIMHAAGSLADGLLMNQTKDTFETSFNAKVNGGWNLHELTLDYNLEYFVLFSSISAVFGAVGQGNYAAANSYLDSLAQYRKTLGLPATSINWGQWDQVGMAKGMKITGLAPFGPDQGLSAMESTLKANKNQVAVVLGDVNIWKSTYIWAKTYFEKLKSSQAITSAKQRSKGGGDELNIDKFWEDLEKSQNSEEKYQIIQTNVAFIISSIMKSENLAELNVNQNFLELGLDSLMRIELKNKLQLLVGNSKSLSLGDIVDANTVHLLSNRLMELLFGNQDKQAMQEERRKLIREDSILPSHIRVVNPTSTKPSEIRTVLVTGVTGNIGPYVLQDLSNRNQISKIYCLVRPQAGKSGIDRVKKSLEDKNLSTITNTEKIAVLDGNISDSNFGIPPEIYEPLTQEVDAVINIAVKSSYTEEYRKTEGNFTDTRSVNVIGCHRVLEFACTNKTKWLFQASSILGTRTGGKSGVLTETWPDPDEFDDVPIFGYAISKFISDRLIAQAVDAGIPSKVFRFPLVAGHSKTGQQSIEDNHFFVKYMYHLKCGMVPNMRIPLQIMPVDTAVHLSLDVFFDDRAHSGMINVMNPHDCSEMELPEFAKQFDPPLGPVKVVEYSDFYNKILEDGKAGMLYTMTEFYTEEERYFKFMNQSEMLKSYVKNPSRFFASEKLKTLIPNYYEVVEHPFTILKRDIKYAMDVGFF